MIILRDGILMSHEKKRCLLGNFGTVGFPPWWQSLLFRNSQAEHECEFKLTYFFTFTRNSYIFHGSGLQLRELQCSQCSRCWCHEFGQDTDSERRSSKYIMPPPPVPRACFSPSFLTALSFLCHTHTHTLSLSFSSFRMGAVANSHFDRLSWRMHFHSRASAD